MSKKSNRFSPEVRERAVRMVQEHRGEYPSLWAAISHFSLLNYDLNMPKIKKTPLKSTSLRAEVKPRLSAKSPVQSRVPRQPERRL
jgi:hypothetical protein